MFLKDYFKSLFKMPPRTRNRVGLSRPSSALSQQHPSNAAQDPVSDPLPNHSSSAAAAALDLVAAAAASASAAAPAAAVAVAAAPAPAPLAVPDVPVGGVVLSPRPNRKGMKHLRVSDADRAMVVSLWLNNGLSAPEICTCLENRVKPKTVYSIMKVFQKESRKEALKSSGRASIYTEQEMKVVEQIQSEFNHYSYRQIREEWRKRTGSNKKLSDSTICKWLQEMDFTTKVLEHEPEGRNTPEAIAFRQNYCMQAAGWRDDEVVYVDEKGFNLHCTRKRGRSKKGRKALIPVVNGRGTNISICAAISPKYGVMAYQIEMGSFNRDKYIEFLKKLLQHPSFQLGPMRIIMDNVRFHQGDLVKSMIENHVYAHQRQFIPPYSPHLNAIEYCFAQWSNFVNQNPKNTQTQLITLIEQAAANTTISDCAGWHRQVTRWQVRCAGGIPLRYEQPREIA